MNSLGCYKVIGFGGENSMAKKGDRTRGSSCSVKVTCGLRLGRDAVIREADI